VTQSAQVLLRCGDVAETRRVAASLAGLARPGQVVALSGPLGAGKTTFVAAYAAALGVATSVTSPSFTLVHHYRCGTGAAVAELLHVDLWRLGSAGELVDLGLDEPLDDGAVAIVEWGDRFDVAPRRPRIDVHFVVTGEGSRELLVDLALAGLPDDARTRLAS
jgi:tRNA threonylcarbamoyladenosine biosynthesis protein TsaE